MTEEPSSAGPPKSLWPQKQLYWVSGMSNGNAHDRSNPPAVLVGGAHGRLKGRHVVAKKDEPTANLLLAMAHVAGADIESLGPSSSRLDL